MTFWERSEFMFAYPLVCFLSSPPHSKPRDWKIQSSETGTDSIFFESLGVEFKLQQKIKVRACRHRLLDAQCGTHMALFPHGH